MSDECKHGYDYQEHCQRYHVIGCREGCFEELKDATNMLGGISDCKYLVKGEEKMSEHLFLEEMKPNPDECKDRLILDTILMKFLSRKVSRLEDEIRYLRRHNNKKNRTIKRLTGQLSNVVVYLGEVCPASRAKVCGAECMDVMGKCQLLPLYRILGVNVERWDK